MNTGIWLGPLNQSPICVSAAQVLAAEIQPRQFDERRPIVRWRHHISPRQPRIAAEQNKFVAKIPIVQRNQQDRKETDAHRDETRPLALRQRRESCAAEHDAGDWRHDRLGDDREREQ
jgi:hypothetical protein